MNLRSIPTKTLRGEQITIENGADKISILGWDISHWSLEGRKEVKRELARRNRRRKSS